MANMAKKNYASEQRKLYEDMLRRAVSTNDQDDARSIRRTLQEIKNEKRRLLAS